MASTTATLKKLERDLGTYFEARLPELRIDYIADQVFPVMQTRLASGVFKRVNIEEILRLEPELKRSPSTGYWRSSQQFTEDTYITYDRGAEEPIDDDERAMYGDFLDNGQIAVDRLIHIILQDKEKRVAAALMDFTYYNGQSTMKQDVTNSTWNISTSTPLADVELARAKFFANTGMWPNAFVISRQTFHQLRKHGEVVSSITASGAGDQARASDVTAEQLARVFGVERLYVGGGAKNTAVIGAAASISSVWPKHAMLCQIAQTNDMMEPCIGRQFHWSGSGSTSGGRVEVYRDEAVRSDIVRCREYAGEKRIHNEMGCMIPNCIA